MRVNGESDGGNKRDCIITLKASASGTVWLYFHPPALLLRLVQEETTALRCSRRTPDVTGFWLEQAKEWKDGSIR